MPYNLDEIKRVLPQMTEEERQAVYSDYPELQPSQFTDSDVMSVIEKMTPEEQQTIYQERPQLKPVTMQENPQPGFFDDMLTRINMPKPVQNLDTGRINNALELTNPAPAPNAFAGLDPQVQQQAQQAAAPKPDEIGDMFTKLTQQQGPPVPQQSLSDLLAAEMNKPKPQVWSSPEEQAAYQQQARDARQEYKYDQKQADLVKKGLIPTNYPRVEDMGPSLNLATEPALNIEGTPQQQGKPIEDQPYINAVAQTVAPFLKDAVPGTIRAFSGLGSIAATTFLSLGNIGLEGIKRIAEGVSAFDSAEAKKKNAQYNAAPHIENLQKEITGASQWVQQFAEDMGNAAAYQTGNEAALGAPQVDWKTREAALKAAAGRFANIPGADMIISNIEGLMTMPAEAVTKFIDIGRTAINEFTGAHAPLFHPEIQKEITEKPIESLWGLFFGFEGLKMAYNVALKPFPKSFQAVIENVPLTAEGIRPWIKDLKDYSFDQLQAEAKPLAEALSKGNPAAWKDWGELNLPYPNLETPKAFRDMPPGALRLIQIGTEMKRRMASVDEKINAFTDALDNRKKAAEQAAKQQATPEQGEVKYTGPKQISGPQLETPMVTKPAVTFGGPKTGIKIPGEGMALESQVGPTEPIAETPKPEQPKRKEPEYTVSEAWIIPTRDGVKAVPITKEEAPTVDAIQGHDFSDLPDFHISDETDNFTTTAKNIYDKIRETGRPPQNAKELYDMTGIDTKTPEGKRSAQEALELAMKEAARHTYAKFKNDPAKLIETMGKLEGKKISTRTDAVNDLQQFSTPPKIASILNLMLEKIKPTGKGGRKPAVYEPTAGNGLLTLSDSFDYIVNEIDAGRAKSLLTTYDNPKGNITGIMQSDIFDGTFWRDTKGDGQAVIANPPFGVGNSEKGFTAKDGDARDYAIIKDSLEKTGAEKGVYIIGDVYPMPAKITKQEPLFKGKTLYKKDYTGNYQEYKIIGKTFGSSPVNDMFEIQNPAGKSYKMPDSEVRKNFEYPPEPSGRMKEFFTWLHDNYNVVLNTPIEGKEFEATGTKYPTRLIVVNGKGKSSRPYDPFQMDRNFKSTQDLLEILKTMKEGEYNDTRNIINGRKSDVKIGSELVEGRPTDVRTDNIKPDNSAVTVGEQEPAAGILPGKSNIETGTDVGRPERPANVAEAPVRIGGTNESSVPANAGKRGERTPAKSPELPADNIVSEELPKQEIERPRYKAGAPQIDIGGRLPGEPFRGTLPQSGESTISGESVRADGKEIAEEPDEKFYKPQNKNRPQKLLIPVNLAEGFEKSVKAVRDEVGDLVKYAKELTGLKSLERTLTGEQIDTLALALHNFERGKPFTIGNDTGTGKGRIAAALLFYADKKGVIPVFMTENDSLMKDIYRDILDLQEISDPDAAEVYLEKDFKMFSFNKAGTAAKYPVVNPLDDSRNIKQDYNWNMVESMLGGTSKVKGVKSKQHYQNVQQNLLKFLKDNNFKAVFTTYSQIRLDKDSPDYWKEIVLSNMVNEGRSYLVLDEAHNAAGSLMVKPGKKGEEGKVEGSSNIFNNILPMVNSSSGTMFLSATFSKSPSTLPIYLEPLKKDLEKIGYKNVAEFIDAIKSYGNSFLEHVAKTFADDGFYTRLQKDLSGARVETKKVDISAEETRNISDGTGKILSALYDVSRKLNDALKGMSEDGPRSNDASIKLEGSEFASKIYNLQNQLLYSLRTDSVARLTADLLAEGKKVFLAVENTMESVIGDLDFSKNIADDLRNLFIDSISKNILKVKSTTSKGRGENRKTLVQTLDLGNVEFIKTDGTPAKVKFNEEQAGLLDNVLGTDMNGENITLRGTVLDVVKQINDLKYRLPISPLDKVKQLIVKYAKNKGVDIALENIGEATGRGVGIGPNGEKITLPDLTKDEKFSRFNEGTANKPTTDPKKIFQVMIGNVSAATGLSAHNSPKFGSALHNGGKGKIRSMIVWQPMGDPNKTQQIFGRIHREGQMTSPEYYILTTGIPMEQRLLGLMIKKLKALNANVSGDIEGGFNFQNVDFMNRLGDDVMYEYLNENSELGEKLGYYYDYKERTNTYELDVNKSDLAQRVMGRMILLSEADQIHFLKEFTDTFVEKIAYLDAVGQNPLTTSTLDLEADILESKRMKNFAVGEKETSMTSPVEYHLIEANKVVNPMPQVKIEKAVLEAQNKNKPYIDSDFKDLRENVKKYIDKRGYDTEKKQIENEKIEETLPDTIEQLKKNYFRLGRFVNIRYRAYEQTMNDQGEIVRTYITKFRSGVLMGLKMPDSIVGAESKLSVDPTKLSNYKIEIASDMKNLEAEKLFIKLSDVLGVEETSYRGERYTSENWDELIKRQTKDEGESDSKREKRLVLTGNLLAIPKVTAWMDQLQGKISITKFTTKDGETMTGVLIPKNYTEMVMGYLGMDKTKYKKAPSTNYAMPLKGNSIELNTTQRVEVNNAFGLNYTDVLRMLEQIAPDAKVRIVKRLREPNFEMVVAALMKDHNFNDLILKSRKSRPDSIIEELKEKMPQYAPMIDEMIRQTIPLGRFSEKSGKIDINAQALKNSPDFQRELTYAFLHEVGHFIDWSTGEMAPTLKRGNIAGHVAALAKWFRHTIQMAPGEDPLFLTPDERRKMYYQAKSMYPDPEDYPLRSAYYRSLVSDYIDDNNLIHKYTLRDELVRATQVFLGLSDDALSAGWNYYTKPAELYANALSMFLNNPKLFFDVAPEVATMLSDYGEANRSTTWDAYNKLQDEIRSGQSNKNTLEWYQNRMAEATAKQADALAKQPNPLSWGDQLAIQMHDTQWLISKRGGFMPGENQELYEANEQWRRVNDTMVAHFKEFLPDLLEKVKAAGIDFLDLGTEASFRRIIYERSQKNVIDVLSPEKAAELSSELHSKWTPEQAQIVNDVLDEYQARRQDIVSEIESLNIFPADLIKEMKDAKNYWTWDVVKHYEDKYGPKGKQLGAQIKAQYGTLSAIANPFFSTILKDAALYKFAKRSKLIKELLKDLDKTGDSKPAALDKEGRFMERRGFDLILDQEEGKIKGYYVPEGFEKAINKDFNEINVVLQTFTKFDRMVKMGYTSLQTAWQVMNVVRDNVSSILLKPYVLRNAATYSKILADEIAKAVTFRQDEKFNTKIQKEGLVLSDYSFNEIEENQGVKDIMNIIEKKLGFKIADNKPIDKTMAEKIVSMLEMAAATFSHIGAVGEKITQRTGTRFYQIVGPKYGMTQIEINHIIRAFGNASQMTKRAGRQKNWYNILRTFANVIKEGYVTTYESAKAYPYSFWPKLIGGALALVGAQAAVRAMDREWWKKINPHYLKNYIVIPGFFFGLPKYDSKGQAICFTIPIPEHLRLVNQFLYNALLNDSPKPSGVLPVVKEYSKTFAGEIPQAGPTLGAISDLIEFAVTGNVYDSYRGQKILNPTLAQAQDYRTLTAFAKYFSNQYGPSYLYRFDTSDRATSNQSLIEQISKMPYPFLNIVGRFLRVSSYGEVAEKQNLKYNKMTENARELLTVKEAAQKVVSGKKGTLTREEKQLSFKHARAFENYKKELKGGK